jgi:hypothetical protein
MTELEKAKFLDALDEASKLLALGQAALHRARSQCHGEMHKRVDLLAKRAFELKVKSDWLRCSALGKIKPGGPNGRQGADRRTGIDRRIVGMQKRMLSLA